MTTSEVFTVERDGHVATLWLDSPERRNAMGPEFWSDLPILMNDLSDDEDVRAVVIAAKGKHFTVGLDLKTMMLGDGSGASSSQAGKASRFLREVKRLQRSVTAVADCPKPVIAAVQGGCIGGGIDLIAACDIRLASADAFFSVRETKMAIVADIGTLQRLPRVLTAGHVAELAYTGKDITAERAREIGLVNDVLPDHDSVVKAAHGMAGEIAANSPVVVRGTKAVLRASEGRTVEEGLDYVAVWNAAFLQSNDLTEAITSFLEKRPPEYRGD
ncbi:MAG TPA: crotonase/enoyl-CoA hydratase family protein [Acidimicrobiales bacterium]|nr:crotonase/enoyl-CoA hydratase family protein [Acidimicrobiales bacterium]